MSFIEQQKRKIAAMYGIKTVPIVIADIQKSELDNQFSGIEKPNFVGANIHEHQRNQNSHLVKSFMNTTDYLEKGGKRAMIGEVRTYAGQKWVKHSDGWVHVSDKGKTKLHANDGKMSEGTEDHTKHFNTHVERHTRESGGEFGQVFKDGESKIFDKFKDITLTTKDTGENERDYYNGDKKVARNSKGGVLYYDTESQDKGENKEETTTTQTENGDTVVKPAISDSDKEKVSKTQEMLSNEKEVKGTHKVTKYFSIPIRNKESTLTSEKGGGGVMHFHTGDDISYNVQTGSLGDLWSVSNHTTGENGDYWKYDYKQTPHFADSIKSHKVQKSEIEQHQDLQKSRIASIYK